MIDLLAWARSAGLPPKPWLVLGKGPTFAHHVDFDLSRFNLFGLNHVVRELPVDVAHAIDIDVVRDCADAIRTNAKWLLIPHHPHVDSAPSSRRLEEFFEDVPVLGELNEAGRLVSYRLELGYAEQPTGPRPTIGARFFSSEAAFNVLAAIGVKEVRSLGIDGGRSYSGAFKDLEGKTMLANTQPTFDLQFAEIAAIVDRNGMEYGPLMPPPEPIRVFVGADESQLVAAAVLEHSIRKHASRRVEFTVMKDMPVPTPRDPANQPRTGFSFYRFLIPKLCGYEGRAIYLDCDMQVFADLSELVDISFDGATVLCTNQPEPPPEWKENPNFKPGRHLAVMVLDCTRLRWDVDEIVRVLDEGRYDYKQLMSELCIVPEEQIAERIPVEWNSLEHYEPGKTKLVHYTVVPTQPWKSDVNPLGHLWIEAYREALEAGALDPELVYTSIEKGYVRPSLAESLPPRRAVALASAGNGSKPRKLRLGLWRVGVRVRQKLASLR